ncbi:hypothetical protein [Maribellus mangrovi]|uniref:hypothetical protein n=1 Tax=Maribellus mangrovi TaxID=3133146 RepID=UPI0030EBC738
MIKSFYIFIILVVVVTVTGPTITCAQLVQPDTTTTVSLQKQDEFYDSLAYRANRNKFTGWLYDILVSPPRPYVDKKALALDYFNKYEGMVIAKVDIQALEVFGPSFTNTEKEAGNWAERFANTIHTKSNLKTIKKQLLFGIGDILDPELMYENERLIRKLPYLKDVKFIVEQDSVYSAFVNVTVLTKDRFSFGASGGVSGTTSGDIRLYNKNIFGIGHEFSVKFVGHLNKEPYLGIETYYKINNISGRFLDMELAYLNTYRDEGFVYTLEKPFITEEIKWGYGMNVSRLFRTERITNDDPIKFEEPINESYYNFWAGYSFNLSTNRENLTQLTLTTSLHNLTFFEKPDVAPGNEHLFANRTMYMAGINLTQRRFVQDQLIYSYGITEDIPEGFKHELLYGYDANEFGDRHYLQFGTSNGNLLLSRKGYLFLSADIGGYFNKGNFEQGQINGEMEFITKLITAGRKQVRSFINLSYTLGIERYELEYLTLGRFDHIRGFSSREAVGQQRFSAKFEHVVFLPRQFYKFNMALFGFADLGIIGESNKLIFTQDYYSGLGVGIRLHNENLVFETFRLRLAFYPFHPKDVSFVGFVLDEQSKRRFMSFDPVQPVPKNFE